MAVIVSKVNPDSLCAKKGVAAGFVLLSVNGHEINDVLDYVAHGNKPVGAALVDFLVTFFAEYTVDLEIIDLQIHIV